MIILFPTIPLVSHLIGLPLIKPMVPLAGFYIWQIQWSFGICLLWYFPVCTYSSRKNEAFDSRKGRTLRTCQNVLTSDPDSSKSSRCQTKQKRVDLSTRLTASRLILEHMIIINMYLTLLYWILTRILTYMNLIWIFNKVEIQRWSWLITGMAKQLDLADIL